MSYLQTLVDDRIMNQINDVAAYGLTLWPLEPQIDITLPKGMYDVNTKQIIEVKKDIWYQLSDNEPNRGNEYYQAFHFFANRPLLKCYTPPRRARCAWFMIAWSGMMDIVPAMATYETLKAQSAFPENVDTSVWLLHVLDKMLDSLLANDNQLFFAPFLTDEEVDVVFDQHSPGSAILRFSPHNRWSIASNASNTELDLLDDIRVIAMLSHSYLSSPSVMTDIQMFVNDCANHTLVPHSYQLPMTNRIFGQDTGIKLDNLSVICRRAIYESIYAHRADLAFYKPVLAYLMSISDTPLAMKRVEDIMANCVLFDIVAEMERLMLEEYYYFLHLSPLVKGWMTFDIGPDPTFSEFINSIFWMRNPIYSLQVKTGYILHLVTRTAMPLLLEDINTKNANERKTLMEASEKLIQKQFKPGLQPISATTLQQLIQRANDQNNWMEFVAGLAVLYTEQVVSEIDMKYALLENTLYRFQHAYLPTTPEFKAAARDFSELSTKYTQPSQRSAQVTKFNNLYTALPQNVKTTLTAQHIDLIETPVFLDEKQIMTQEDDVKTIASNDNYWMPSGLTAQTLKTLTLTTPGEQFTESLRNLLRQFHASPAMWSYFTARFDTIINGQEMWSNYAPRGGTVVNNPKAFSDDVKVQEFFRAMQVDEEVRKNWFFPQNQYFIQKLFAACAVFEQLKPNFCATKEDYMRVAEEMDLCPTLFYPVNCDTGVAVENWMLKPLDQQQNTLLQYLIKHVEDNVLRDSLWWCENKATRQRRALHLLRWLGPNYRQQLTYSYPSQDAINVLDTESRRTLFVLQFLHRCIAAFPYISESEAATLLASSSENTYLLRLDTTTPLALIFETKNKDVVVTVKHMDWLQWFRQVDELEVDDRNPLARVASTFYYVAKLLYKTFDGILFGSKRRIEEFASRSDCTFDVTKSSWFKNVEGMETYMDLVRPTDSANQELWTRLRNLTVVSKQPGEPGEQGEVLCGPNRVARAYDFGKGSSKEKLKGAITGSTRFGAYSGKPDCIDISNPENKDWMMTKQRFMYLPDMQKLRNSYASQRIPTDYLDQVIALWPKLDDWFMKPLFCSVGCEGNRNKTILINWLGIDGVEFLSGLNDASDLDPQLPAPDPSPDPNYYKMGTNDIWFTALTLNDLRFAPFFHPFLNRYDCEKLARQYPNFVVLSLDMTRPRHFRTTWWDGKEFHTSAKWRASWFSSFSRTVSPSLAVFSILRTYFGRYLNPIDLRATCETSHETITFPMWITRIYDWYISTPSKDASTVRIVQDDSFATWQLVSTLAVDAKQEAELKRLEEELKHNNNVEEVFNTFIANYRPTDAQREEEARTILKSVIAKSAPKNLAQKIKEGWQKITDKFAAIIRNPSEKFPDWKEVEIDVNVIALLSLTAKLTEAYDRQMRDQLLRPVQSPQIRILATKSQKFEEAAFPDPYWKTYNKCKKPSEGIFATLKQGFKERILGAPSAEDSPETVELIQLNKYDEAVANIRRKMATPGYTLGAVEQRFYDEIMKPSEGLPKEKMGLVESARAKIAEVKKSVFGQEEPATPMPTPMPPPTPSPQDVSPDWLVAKTQDCARNVTHRFNAWKEGDNIERCGRLNWIVNEPIASNAADLLNSIAHLCEWWKPDTTRLVWVFRWLGFECRTKEIKDWFRPFDSSQRLSPDDQRALLKAIGGPKVVEPCKNRVYWLYHMLRSTIFFPFVPSLEYAQALALQNVNRVVVTLDPSVIGRALCVRTMQSHPQLESQGFDVDDFDTLRLPSTQVRLRVFQDFAGGIVANNLNYYKTYLNRTPIYDLNAQVTQSLLPPEYALKFQTWLTQKQGFEKNNVPLTPELLAEWEGYRNMTIKVESQNLTLADLQTFQQIRSIERMPDADMIPAAQRLYTVQRALSETSMAQQVEVMALCQRPEFVPYLRTRVRQIWPDLSINQVATMDRKELCRRLIMLPEISSMEWAVSVKSITGVPVNLRDPKSGYINLWATDALLQNEMNMWLMAKYGLTLMELQRYNPSQDVEKLGNAPEEKRDVKQVNAVNRSRLLTKTPCENNTTWTSPNGIEICKEGTRVPGLTILKYLQAVYSIMCEDQTTILTNNVQFLDISYGLLHFWRSKTMPNVPQETDLMLKCKACQAYVVELSATAAQLNLTWAASDLTSFFTDVNVQNLNKQLNIFTEPELKKINLEAILNQLNGTTPELLHTAIVMLLVYVGLWTSTFILPS